MTQHKSKQKNKFALQKAVKKLSLALMIGLTMGTLAACGEPVNPSTEKPPVESIVLSKNELTLAIGETHQLTATVTPGEAAQNGLSWRSSDPSVAEVADGKVTAKSEGQTTITVQCGDKEASCSVNVTKKSVIASKKVTYAEIVGRMYKDEWKSQSANLGESTYQWSTADVRSIYNEETGKYEAWDSNDDGSLKIRDDEGNSVGVELTGSGYVSSMWFGQIWRGGTITIVVDGKKVVHMDLLEYITGEKSIRYATDGAIQDAVCQSYRTKHTYGNLSYASSKGFNTFIPISFSESLKIYFTNDTESSNYDAAHFKQIRYVLFDDKREVEGFVDIEDMSAENKAALEAANEAMSFVLEPNTSSYTVSANSEIEVYNDSKPGAITLVTMTLPDVPAEKLQETLRYTYIKANWDGMNTPAIEMSLGDFFGSPAQVETYRTWNIGVTDDRQFYARFYMPYESAKIVVGNLLGQDVKVNIDFASHEITKADADASMRFCASWQKAADRDLTSDRWPDATTLSLTGTGRLLGQYWHTYQLFEGFWWGEGDERIFVNGEKMPCWYGTGGEDVIGYSYSIPYSWPFSAMFRAHPVGAEEHGNIGDKINVLLFSNDPVAFDTEIEMSLEKYFVDNYCYLSAVSYYYLEKEDIAANYKGKYDVNARNACAPLVITDAYPNLMRYEGEFLNSIVEITRGNHYRQNMPMEWSGSKHLCWFNCGNGSDSASLSFPISVAEDGKYKVSISFTKAIDYVIVDVYLDGKKIGENINLYSPEAQKMIVELGLQELAAGLHTVQFVVVGVDPRAGTNNGNYVFGFDYIDIVPEDTIRIEADMILHMNLKTSGGEIRQQTFDNGAFTNASFLTFINPAHEKGWISFDVVIPEDGSYTLEGNFVKAFDFPILNVYFDGKLVGEPVDLFHIGQKSTGSVNFGTMDLKAGVHTITIKTPAKNPDSAGYVFAIDHIDLIKNAE